MTLLAEILSTGPFDMEWYDDDLQKMLFRLAINLTVITLIVRYIYYPIAQRKDYLITYMLISVIVFFICFTLKKFELGLGMALGLFALFGILRYRTDPIPIKEMTYLFVVIGVSVINSLANKKMSLAELALTNGTILGVTYGLERLWLIKHEATKNIIYEKIDLIHPSRSAELKSDLEERTGITINRIEIGKIDFLKDTAQIRIHYYHDEQTAQQQDEGLESNDD